MAYAYGTLDVLNRAGRTRTWSDADRKSAYAMISSYAMAILMPKAFRSGRPTNPTASR